MITRNGRRIYLYIALLIFTLTGCLIQAPPAFAWDDWPAATTDDPNHTWTIVFEQEMNTSTINDQNIYVSGNPDGNSRMAGVGVKASDSTHAMVSPPNGGWKTDTNYYLIITQKVLTIEDLPLEDAICLPFSISDKDSSDKTLTPDYWIPEVPKTNVFECDKKDKPIKEIWTKNSKGYYTVVPDDTAKLTQVYMVKGNTIEWVQNEWKGNSNNPATTIDKLTSGKNYLSKPIKPGQSWEDVYQTSNKAKHESTTSFIGFETINVLGKTQQAAHLKTTGTHYYEEWTYKFNNDVWLVKGIGLVKGNYAGESIWPDKTTKNQFSVQLLSVK